MKTILCLGDSNTYGFDPRSYLGGRYPENVRWTGRLKKKGYTVLNRGFTGKMIPQQAYKEKADIVIVMFGTNDLLNGDDPDRIAAKMEKFLRSLSEEKIILVSVPPMTYGSWVEEERLIHDADVLGDLYEDIAQRMGITFADCRKWDLTFAFDGVHFSEEAHERFAEEIAKMII